MGLGTTEIPEIHSSDDEYEGSVDNGNNRISKKAAKKLAEEKYNEAKELTSMSEEEELSILFENFIEDKNCKAFMTKLMELLNNQSAEPKDKAELKKIAAIIKPINVINILTGLRTSWARLDEIIRETAARVREKELLNEQLRTEEGIKRQQSILEFAEDIEELQSFLHKAGLSKITAKRCQSRLHSKLVSK